MKTRRMYFRGRGHYCNYCRKILRAKCPGVYTVEVNKAMWHVWELRETQMGIIHEFIDTLVALRHEGPIRQFNQKLKKISEDFRKR